VGVLVLEDLLEGRLDVGGRQVLGDARADLGGLAAELRGLVAQLLVLAFGELAELVVLGLQGHRREVALELLRAADQVGGVVELQVDLLERGRGSGARQRVGVVELGDDGRDAGLVRDLRDAVGGEVADHLVGVAQAPDQARDRLVLHRQDLVRHGLLRVGERERAAVRRDAPLVELPVQELQVDVDALVGGLLLGDLAPGLGVGEGGDDFLIGGLGAGDVGRVELLVAPARMDERRGGDVVVLLVLGVLHGERVLRDRQQKIDGLLRLGAEALRVQRGGVLLPVPLALLLRQGGRNDRRHHCEDEHPPHGVLL
jgi:hypothetical protein